jgi:hypothetical protein
MNRNIVIRPGTAADAGAIKAVAVAAFKTLAISKHTGKFVIAALRAADALSLSSLVAWSDTSPSLR